MDFEAFQTKRSPKPMSPIEIAKQGYKDKLAREKAVQQASGATRRNLQLKQDALALCNETHKRNLAREEANYELFKAREMQRHALALERADE